MKSPAHVPGSFILDMHALSVRGSDNQPSHRRGARLLLYPDDQQFDAYLPRLEKAVRITGLYDAQVFTRRWIIRDKDPALKALMRCLDQARSSETAASALVNFKNALASRGLLTACPS